jgi:hypothetical protein
LYNNAPSLVFALFMASCTQSTPTSSAESSMAASAQRGKEAPETSPKTFRPSMSRWSPSDFSILLVAGESQQQGAAKEGMIKSKTEPVSQVLYWTVPSSSLRERASQERGLIERAANDTTHVRADKEFTESRSPGAGALSWSAVVDNTHFEFILVDCRTHHVLITTMGPSVDTTAAIHRESTNSLVCTVGDPSK